MDARWKVHDEWFCWWQSGMIFPRSFPKHRIQSERSEQSSWLVYSYFQTVNLVAGLWLMKCLDLLRCIDVLVKCVQLLLGGVTVRMV